MKSIYRLCVRTAAVLLLMAASCYAGPRVFMPQRNFTFEPVPDGTVLTHEYIVQNHGDEPLEILEIGTT